MASISSTPPIPPTGVKTEVLITISTQGPTITVTSPTNGDQYPAGAVITSSFACASPVGIKANGCVQTSPTPGTPLSSALGTHAVIFKATDTLGRFTTKNVTYNVVAVSPALTTTTIVASPAKPALGSPVKFTVAVAPSGGAVTGPGPTGTVRFYLDGQSRIFATASLVAGTASVSSSGLGAGSHLMTASYGGDTNFAPSSSTTTATITVTCKTTITGNHSGSVVLGAGANCVVGANITAAITVPKGAVLDIEGSTVTGSIVATRLRRAAYALPAPSGGPPPSPRPPVPSCSAMPPTSALPTASAGPGRTLPSATRKASRPSVTGCRAV